MRSPGFQDSLAPAVALALVTALAFLVIYSRFVIIHALIGIGIGVLASPLLNTWLQRWRLPRILGGFLLFVMIISTLALVFCLVYQLVADQANLLSERFPDIFMNLRTRFSGLFRTYPWAKTRIEEFSMMDTFQTGLRQIFLGVQVGFMALANFALDVLIGIYTAIYAEQYFKGLVAAFPARLRKKAESILMECGVVLRKWFRAQLIDMVIIGLITASGLWIVGLEYWAVFGLLTAVLGIIPYIGMLFVVIAACFITMASQPDLVPWVILVFAITQQIEGNLVLPVVMKGQAELPEVPLLIFMLLMGAWFGVLGVFVAPPLFSALRIAYIRIYLPKMDVA
jgi:predicted PurR-regulated permease PerM